MIKFKPSYQFTAGGFAQLIKDLRDKEDSQVVEAIVVVERSYTVNMVLSLDEKPKAIELIRCTNVKIPDQPVNHDTAVSWAWTPKGARITRLGGLTPSEVPYQLTFRITL